MKDFEQFWKNVPTDMEEAGKALVILGENIHGLKEGDKIPFEYIKDLIFTMAFADFINSYLEKSKVLAPSEIELSAEQIAQGMLEKITRGLH